VAEIEVYADIWCPFAHAGLRWLVRRRQQLGREDVAIRVRAWPLELVNGAPLDPAVTAEHVADLRAQVAEESFRNFDPDHFPKTSLPALALAAAAYRRDGITGELVSLAVRDALFEEGLDISRPDVLAGVARAYGVDHPNEDDEGSVLLDWHSGETRSVKGSPHFFCGEIDSFCPSLDISRDEEGHLQVRRNMEALDAFLTKCFEGTASNAARPARSDLA
jgi:2-hydroxychromene-2-carboxylate isomerase